MADALIAFRDGDKGEMGYLGALIQAQDIQMRHAFVEGWFKAHSKK